MLGYLCRDLRRLRALSGPAARPADTPGAHWFVSREVVTTNSRRMDALGTRWSAGSVTSATATYSQGRPLPAGRDQGLDDTSVGPSPLTAAVFNPRSLSASVSCTNIAYIPRTSPHRIARYSNGYHAQPKAQPRRVAASAAATCWAPCGRSSASSSAPDSCRRRYLQSSIRKTPGRLYPASFGRCIDTP